jgi:hypothetical protein
MTATAAPHPPVPWLRLTLLVAAVVGLQLGRDRLTPPAGPEAAPVLWLQSPDLARALTLSFDDVAADIYWMRAIIHYGGERRRATGQRYALLYPLLDMTTSLDPHFDVAARLGAVFLSEGYPGGPGRPDQALALLEKGQRHAPSRWQYEHDIGFVHYWWLKDYRTAGLHFQRASVMPGAPIWLKSLAGTTLLDGGDRAGARRLWQELYASAEVDWMRRAAEYRLAQLQALDDIDALTARVAEVARRTGRQPQAWQDLIAAGALRRVPTDPAGVAYALESSGRVTLGDGSGLAPLPALEASR